MTIFEPGRNCWRVETAACASLLIDVAPYYRALHDAIVHACHSIFVLGWDIDSRIELLRGKEAEDSPFPTSFFELICWKAEQHPDIRIYLNRWDYSFYLLAEREGLSRLRWSLLAPPNVHYCLDDSIPVGACHHQKIVVVDDEIAFSGGMDIALGRWDWRSHFPRQAERIDPAGTYQPILRKPFGPHHDVQAVVSGPAANALARLARHRWRMATGDEPIPLRESAHYLPPAWPKSTPPHFLDATTGIALTLPPQRHRPPVTQVEQLYIDMIARAERFIYIENQYLTCTGIARALNRRLQENPHLRVLIVSCYDPEGIMERKAMYHGRVHFRDALQAGGVGRRAVMAYPISRVQGVEKPVRIHSKVMIVDDHYLRIASSNINQRSMTLDTECDLVIEADDEGKRNTIARLRNDLIREHTGYTTEHIQKLIDRGADAEDFLIYHPQSRQHLCKINDEHYRYESFTRFAKRLADPEKPLLPPWLPMGRRIRRKYIARLWRFLLIALLVAGMPLLWQITPLGDYTAPERLTPWLSAIRSNPWAWLIAIAAYALGGLIFFPHWVLTTAAAIAFAPLSSFLISITGSLISAAIAFLAGTFLERRFLHLFLGGAVSKVHDYLERGGVAGIALLRMVPLAPFTAVNIGLGILRIPFSHFIIGTGLALLPGILALSFFGDSLMSLWQHPNATHIAYAMLGGLAWVIILAVTHRLTRRLRK